MGLMTAEISAKHLVPLCRQMATSYDAGLPIIRTLEMMSDNAKDARAKQVFRAMAEDTKQGATLGEAARRQKKYLPKFFIELLHSGELGGRLDVMLHDLASYYEDRLTMQRKIVGAMVYPALQLGAAWYLGTFSLGLIGKINPDAREPFNLSDYFSQYFMFQGFATGLFFLAIVAIIVLSRLGVINWSWGLILNYIWPLNTVNKKFGLARFFRSFSLLVGSGMNIQSCIANAAAISGNPWIEKDLKQAIPKVAAGHTLVESFAGCRSLTPLAREMLEVGERSGNLEASLRKVSDYHLEEGRHAVGIATKILGVLIVLGVGAVVGYVVISFYSSLFSISDSFM
ncbi:MAG: type II secretion system F family protein [Candidatus Hydrogenedentes bacterium]|nr:type II secretion system F family protein [Candidatus Hydrogenedentota bacterium]